ncbi:SRPBCC family protein [Glutamicibacter sp.]|uniref:SRPBCC family protein n=1 Tax=Glutamicibacter sp. TaxID=1931995 RepID=UPI0028BE2D6E|nr:SRPBCC family protein [Glutamicibacter sp.]
MAVYFECVTRTKMSVEQLFDKSLSIDAHTASMAQSGERAVGGVTAGRIGWGEQVTWRATHFGIPFKMTSKITALDAPHTFTDEQQRGPFKRFHHVHEFFAVRGETIMVDKIHFQAPLGPLGWIAERLVLGWYMPKLIRLRNQYLISEGH